MALLRALVATARMMRHTSRLAAGLTPDDLVRLDAPDERLGPALAAAGRGDHRPAAALLATTREGAEWESRDSYVSALARLARPSPGGGPGRSDWLRDWLAGAPRDPDAALVRAALAVRRARWQRAGVPRAAAPAAPAPLLPLVHAAADASPHDPVPWRVALQLARVSHAPRAEFDAHWADAVKRSPHHYGCHVAALGYLADSGCCAERGADTDTGAGGRTAEGGGGGTRTACLDFAEHAARQALPGSLLRALPARAALAHLGTAPDERLDAAADLGIDLSGRYATGDPWPAEARNLLAYLLILRGRWAEALDQFRLIGPRATAFPWNRISDDPLGQFLEIRDGTRIQVASMTPLCRRPGRTTADGHYA